MAIQNEQQRYDFFRSFGGDENARDLIGRSLGEQRTLSERNAGLRTSQVVGANVGRLGTALEGFGANAYPAAFSQLLNILAGQGKTDPKLMNRELADIDRTTQGQQTDLQGQLAAQGFGRSGLGAALGAAVGQGGADRRADRIATENQMAEQRKRSDLGLVIDMLINPINQQYGIASGVGVAEADRSSQQNAAMIAAIASIFGGS